MRTECEPHEHETHHSTSRICKKHRTNHFLLNFLLHDSLSLSPFFHQLLTRANRRVKKYFTKITLFMFHVRIPICIIFFGNNSPVSSIRGNVACSFIYYRIVGSCGNMREHASIGCNEAFSSNFTMISSSMFHFFVGLFFWFSLLTERLIR